MFSVALPLTTTCLCKLYKNKQEWWTFKFLSSPHQDGRKVGNVFSFFSSSHKFVCLKLFSLHYVLCTCLVSAVCGGGGRADSRHKTASNPKLNVAEYCCTQYSMWRMLHWKLPYYNINNEYIRSSPKRFLIKHPFILFLNSVVFNWAFLPAFQVEFTVWKGFTWTHSRDFWGIFSFWVKKK